jgi:hypothetical protein
LFIVAILSVQRATAAQADVTHSYNNAIANLRADDDENVSRNFLVFEQRREHNTTAYFGIG